MTFSSHDSSGSVLHDLGIEEVEPMVCEDTFDNRARLRGAKLFWEQLSAEDGMPSGLIRAFNPEELKTRRDSVWENRKAIMQDPTNMWSEYVSPDDYPLDYDMPWWLQQRLRGWIDQAVKGVAPEDRRQFPVRCEVIRTDGTRCWNWAPNPKEIKRCKQHRGWVQEKDLRQAQVARLKMLQAAPAMADGLEELAMSASGEAIRLKAMTEILDRAGVRGGVELDITAEVTQVDPSIQVRERLSRLADRLKPAAALEQSGADIIDAEVVSDDGDTGSGSGSGSGGARVASPQEEPQPVVVRDDQE